MVKPSQRRDGRCPHALAGSSVLSLLLNPAAVGDVLRTVRGGGTWSDRGKRRSCAVHITPYEALPSEDNDDQWLWTLECACHSDTRVQYDDKCTRIESVSHWRPAELVAHGGYHL